MGGGQKIPNYICQAQNKDVAVTAGTTPAFSAQIGTLLELYKYHRYEHVGGMDLEGLKFSSLVKFCGHSSGKEESAFAYLPNRKIPTTDSS